MVDVPVVKDIEVLVYYIYIHIYLSIDLSIYKRRKTSVRYRGAQDALFMDALFMDSLVGERRVAIMCTSYTMYSETYIHI